jgi:hypothetical protein
MLAHICAASLFLMWLFSIVGMQFYQGEPILSFFHPTCTAPLKPPAGLV